MTAKKTRSKPANSPLAAKDILLWRNAGSLALSPDGFRLAFVETWSDADENSNRAAIWLLNLNEDQPARQITFGPRRDSSPKWSPDGERLAFLSNRKTEWRSDLYVLDMVAGGEPNLVATLPRGMAEFAWSPDGTRFALTGGPEYPNDRNRPTDDPEERRKRYQERTVYVNRMHYRADGVGYKDDEESALWICPADGGEPEVLVPPKYPLSSPGWTPDGRVCFLSSRDENHELTWNSQLWAIPAEGGEPTLVSKTNGAISGYRFNESGSLGCLAYPVTGFPIGCYDTQLVIDGEIVSGELGLNVGKHVLADTIDLLAWSGTPISSDADDFYFDVSNEGAVHLYRYRDGKFHKVLDGNRVVGEFAIAGDVLVFTSTAPDDPASIRVSRLDGSDERVIHDPNPWMRERPLSEWRELWVEVDGVKSQAWVMMPPGKPKARKSPTIVHIHGGPHGAYGWSFNIYLQLLAGAGYAVIFGNPPGSLSYGEKFTQLIHKAWGEADFPHLMAYCDEAVAQGIADEKRLGVTGGSYGGYLTLWTVGHTDRFKAAVAARPPSNLESEWGTSEFGWSLMRTCFESHPWEAPDLFKRLSPLTYVENVQTPLRLIACTHDYRVPMEQSEQVYIKLKVLGRTVDLVVFRGSHMLILSGSPWQRVEHMEAIRSWFEKHMPAVAKR